MLPSLIRIEIKKVTNLDCKCKMIQEQNHRLRASYGQSLKAYTTRVGVKTKNYCVNLRRKKISQWICFAFQLITGQNRLQLGLFSIDSQRDSYSSYVVCCVYCFCSDHSAEVAIVSTPTKHRFAAVFCVWFFFSFQ